MYIIASDIHGSSYYTKLLLEKFKQHNCKKMFLLGDILYHGPRNPLPKEYNPELVFTMLNELKSNIVWVKGNCDSEVDEMVLEIKCINESVLVINNTNFYLSHGHITNEDNNNLSKGDYLINGHTHINKYEEKDGVHYLNCGSISLPKGGTTNSYLIIDETIKCLDFDDNIIFEVKYV